MRAGLPYFDILLDGLEQGKPGVTAVFGAHVHWGYWGPGDRVDDSVQGFAAAAERMSFAVAEAAGARDGQRVLDVGCGFGGTIAHLDRRLDGVTLVGLNIDPRQLDRARQQVHARNGNTLSFVEGDACEMQVALDVTGREVALRVPLVRVVAEGHEFFYRFLLTLNDDTLGVYVASVRGECVFLSTVVPLGVAATRATALAAELVAASRHYRSVLERNFGAEPAYESDDGE